MDQLMFKTNSYEKLRRTETLRKALIEIRKLKSELQERTNTLFTSIAVVGMACRFPGGIHSPESFWRSLVEQKNMITKVPDNRWLDYPREKISSNPYLSKAGFLTEDIEAFDNRLFRYSPREAQRSDPQQRLFLKVCWEALENSARIPNRLKGTNTGIYAGISVFDHIQRLYLKQRDSNREPQDVMGSSFSFITGRAAYFFGFQGPAVTLDTACSSSLVAVDQACKGLALGDCDMALAGGVNLLLSPETTELMTSLNVLSPDCQVSSFDASANGTVRGEGCGIVVLKKLSDAERDGDHIHAVLIGSGTNQDGLSSGVTVPYGPSQEKLIREVWKRSGIDSGSVDLVETHGTGTELGDPIEAEALGKVISPDRKSPLYLGAVKSAIGHLEAAAGIAGLIKAILCVEKGVIPGNLHFNTPSPRIPWNSMPIRVPTETFTWNKQDGERIAAVSSFGLSGTNAHAVIKEYKAPSETASESIDGNNKLKWQKTIETEKLQARSWPFRFSATHQTALRKQIETFLSYLKKNNNVSLRDLSFSHNQSRPCLKEQIVIWVKDKTDLNLHLQLVLDGQAPPYCQIRKPESMGKKMVFLFSGTGVQYPGMLRDLYEENPVFRRHLEECRLLYRELRGSDLLTIIFEDPHKIDQVSYTQVSLFSVEYSLGRMWMDYGIFPACLIGHSTGEYVAACLAEVFDLKDGISLITSRGELLESLPKIGKMVIVRDSEEKLSDKLLDWTDVYIAATNTPNHTVISGEAGKVDAFCRELEMEDIAHYPMADNIAAYHSPLIEPILPAFEKISRSIRYHPPKYPILSNLEGKDIKNEIARYEYWSKHLISPVRFRESIISIEPWTDYIFLDVSPLRFQTKMVEATVQDRADYLVSCEPDEPSAFTLDRSLFYLANAGMDVNWNAYYKGCVFKKVAIPNYTFDEKNFSLDTDSRTAKPQTYTEEGSSPLFLRTIIKFENVEQVKSHIGDCLLQEWKAEEESIAYDENLLERGLDSITTAKLISRWQDELFIRLKVAPFFTQPTIGDWANIIFEKIQTGETFVSSGTEFLINEADRHKPFALSDIQNAYWVGRNPEIAWGGFGCYGYTEIDSDTLDPERFQDALHQLIDRHEMLRVRIDKNGQQTILPRMEYPLRIYGHRHIEDLAAHLKSIKEEMSSQTLPLGQPMFDLRLSEKGHGKWRIHFGIDFMICDALSIRIFWRDLFKLYQGEALPPIEVSFRDYVHYLMARKGDDSFQADKRYWLNRIDSLPEGPKLPLSKIDTNMLSPGGKFAHKEKWFDKEKWHRFVQSAARQKLTPSAAMIAIFSEVLSAWGAGKEFGLILTVFERDNVHPHIQKLIGDFTQLSLLAVHREQQSLSENARALQRQMQEDLEHRKFCAVDVVREINQKKNQVQIYTPSFLPVLWE